MNTSFERSVVLDKFVSPILYASLIVLFASAYLVLQALDANQSLFFSLNYASQQILPDALAAHLTELGNGALVGVLALVLVILSPDVAKRFLFITLLTAVVIAGLKQFFNDPRPAGVLSIEEFHIIGDVLKKYSFPSGHTTTAFAMAGFVLLTYQSAILRSTVLMLALLAGFARISVGAHWPEDVFAGAALGLMLAFIGAYLSQQPFKRLGSYFAAAFLALACLVGNLTAPADFPEITSIGYTRLFFTVLAVVAGCYFCIRLFQEYSATKKAASD
jgi:membrane-associated phospholipid phosphatase